MISLNLTYYPYELKFKKPFTTSKRTIEKREGFLIKISESKFNGMGECAPLAEYGTESLIEAKNKLDNFKLKLNLNPEHFFKNLNEALSELDSFPSLKHGIEQAILNLVCSKTKITLNELLNVPSNKEINVNAVIGFLSPEESVNICGKYLKEGFNTIKLKVGRDNFADDLIVIKTLREKLGYDFRIRVDANGKWDANQAVKIINMLEKYKIEYVEQPVNSSEDFKLIKENTTVPIAADESIRTFDDAEKFIKNKIVDILILKPMMLGGLLPTLRIIEFCEKSNVNVVITSSLESSLGRANAIFAASTINNNFAHGLGTAKYFIKDLFDDPYPVKRGKIILN